MAPPGGGRLQLGLIVLPLELQVVNPVTHPSIIRELTHSYHDAAHCCRCFIYCIQSSYQSFRIDIIHAYSQKSKLKPRFVQGYTAERYHCK